MIVRQYGLCSFRSHNHHNNNGLYLCQRSDNASNVLFDVSQNINKLFSYLVSKFYKWSLINAICSYIEI